MFKFKAKNKVVVVYTKQELKDAMKKNEPYIEVKGDLAKQLKWIGKLSHKQILLLIPAVASVVIPGAGPAISATAIASITGTEIAGIILASTVFAGVVLGILKGYNVEADISEDTVKLTCKK
jgi:hypothetical protein